MSGEPPIQYIPIKTDFRSRGFHYKQLKREGDIAIYLQTSIKTQRTSWEVIKITRHKGYKIAGHEFPPAEMYPSNTQWGALGWTYTSIQEAEEKFSKLTNLGTPEATAAAEAAAQAAESPDIDPAELGEENEEAPADTEEDPGNTPTGGATESDQK